eukprot:TRINITY_DN639_c0_g1_i1.p1 TRINITY_DN639_c0_g1~~TRINITY_DN639_c0_g1_i1.p1  ORF type:complete len:112 (+),score=4.35 TRINITY_DN639_c0_g1_i1:165-500(+)
MMSTVGLSHIRRHASLSSHCADIGEGSLPQVLNGGHDLDLEATVHEDQGIMMTIEIGITGGTMTMMTEITEEVITIETEEVIMIETDTTEGIDQAVIAMRVIDTDGVTILV